LAKGLRLWKGDLREKGVLEVWGRSGLLYSSRRKKCLGTLLLYKEHQNFVKRGEKGEGKLRMGRGKHIHTKEKKKPNYTENPGPLLKKNVTH